MEKLQFNSSKVSQLFYYDAVLDSWIPVSSSSPLPVQTNVIAGVDVSVYNEIDNINSNALTKVVDYLVPASGTFLLNKIDVNGDNVAEYTFKVNSVTWDKKFSSFFEYPITFDFYNFNKGFQFNAGDLLELWVIHNRPFLGSFNARIQGLLI
jgi:hypothetical protein